MDPKERINSPAAALRAVQDGVAQRIWTALPAIVQAFDATNITADVQIAIQRQVRSPKGDWTNQTLQVNTKCPVCFQSGGGAGLFFSLQQGDEGLLIVASRCIAAWWAQGGIQPQPQFRVHDLSDGFFLPGVFSQPRKPSAAVAPGVAQLRTLDGQTFVEVGAGEVSATCDGGQTAYNLSPGQFVVDIGGAPMMTISAAGMSLNGNLNVLGNITVPPGHLISFGGINFLTHKHTGVSTGGGSSGGPIN
jgi:hypothetical protein